MKRRGRGGRQWEATDDLGLSTKKCSTVVLLPLFSTALLLLLPIICYYCPTCLRTLPGGEEEDDQEGATLGRPG